MLNKPLPQIPEFTPEQLRPPPQPVMAYLTIPASIAAGLFVAIYMPGALVYVGPFAGISAFYSMAVIVMRNAKAKGATHTELIDVAKEREDNRLAALELSRRQRR